MANKIEISHKTIIFAVGLLILIWFVHLIKDILLMFFIALFIMTILNPVVDNFSKKGLQRVWSVVLIYIIFLLVLGLSLYGIVPLLIDQTASFLNNLPRIVENLSFPPLINDLIIEQFLAQIGALPRELAKLALSLLSNVLAVFTVLVFSFYMLLSRDRLHDQLGIFFGREKNKRIRQND